MPTVLVHPIATHSDESLEIKQFDVEKNQIVFEALETQGLYLPHGCLAGSCGSCRVEILSGSELLSPKGAVETDTVNHLQELYPNSEIRLSCRLKIVADGKIEIRPLK